MKKSEFIAELSKLTPQEINKLIETKGKESRKISPFVYIENPNNKKLI